LVSIPLRHLFAVTSWLVLLLAAGMASQAAAFLLQADLLPPLITTLWDTSFLLSEKSIPGRVLHTLIGYTAQPAGIQLVFYLATLLIIGCLMRLIGGGAPPTGSGKSRLRHREA
jgi:high-affinity iron transporter